MLKPLNIPQPYQAHLRLGTCSWKYDDWKGLVYHSGRSYKAGDYLADYARYYNGVEVDQWFWSLFPGTVRLPDPVTVRQYAESVPDDFQFSIKVPNAVTLTHFYAKQPKGSQAFANQVNPYFLDVEVFGDFLERLQPMQGKLGPLMFQFEYLNRTKMPSLKTFLNRFDAFICQLPQGYRYAVEIRNPNYLKPEFFAFLKQHALGMVLLDGYYMPPIQEVVQDHDVHTCEYLVMRLHGTDRQAIEQQARGLWGQIVMPRQAGLEAAGRIIQGAVSKGLQAYVNVNNHYEGCAPLTIERLVSVLGCIRL